MNKVTSYFKNVAKSTAYATSDLVVKKFVPEVADFAETNEELFKATFATLTHFKKSIRMTTIRVKQSDAYKEINAGLNNVIEDIKTGNFYNKARSDKFADDAGTYLATGGEDWEDFDFGGLDNDDGSLDDFGDFDDFDDFDDDDGGVSITKGDVVVADTVAKSSNMSAQLISKTVASTSNNIVKSNITTTNMMMSQNVELVAGIRTSIAGVHESVNGLLRIAQELPEQFNLRNKFFDESISIMKESNAYLKEIAEMQRNTYKRQVEEFKSKDQFGTVFGGGTDLTEYAKVVWKNIKGLDKSGSVETLFSKEMGASMISGFFANPLGSIVTNLIAGYMPGNLVKQVASFSKTLGNFFPVLASRMNHWAKNESGWKSWVGQIFGVSTENKKSIDTAKYHKEAVPFDGITRKAIVDVIPEHLSRIESLLSGTSQRTYNFETGKWMTFKDIEKKKKADYKALVESAFSDLSDDISNYIKSLEKSGALSAKDKKALEDSIYKMKEEAFEEKNRFSPDQIIKDAENGRYADSPFMEGLGRALKNVPLSKLSSVASGIADSRSRYARNMHDMEVKGYDVLRKFFDDSKLDSHLKFNKDHPDIIDANKASINILNLRDSDGKNTLDYLKQILINVAYIREYGSIGGGSGKKRRKGTSGKPFDEFSKSFDVDYTPEDLAKAKAAKEKADKNYNEKNNKGFDSDAAMDRAVSAVKRSTDYSDLDDDIFEKVGTHWKEETKWMKAMEKLPGATLREKWEMAGGDKNDREIIIKGMIGTAVRKPVSLLSEMIDNANASIYKFLFGAETDEFDEEGNKIKGFFNAMLNKMTVSWNNLTSYLQEKIDKIADRFELRQKWDNFKEKIKGTKPAQLIKGAKDKLVDALKSNGFDIFDYVSDAVVNNPAVSAVVNDPYVAEKRYNAVNRKLEKDKTNVFSKQINEFQPIKDYKKSLPKFKLNQEDIKDINKDNPINAPGTPKVEEEGWVYVHKGEAIVPEEEASKARTSKAIKEAISRASVNNVLSNPYRVSQEKLFTNYVHEMANADKGLLAKLNNSEAIGKVKELGRVAKNKTDRITENMHESGPITAIADEATKLKDFVSDRVDKVLGINGNTKEEKEKSINEQKKTLLHKVSDVLGEMKGEGADVAAKALIGGGVGLLTGIVGGPLIGAGLGAAISLTKNSETVNKFLFGEETTDEHGNVIKKGGLVPKNIQDTFKKYVPDMGKFATAGAVASFLTPFGPLVGAALGAGAGFIKNSETMNEMIFGEEGGLINKDRKEKLRELLPKAGLGAIIGAGAGLIGPFGILGGAAVGAGAGLLAGTEEFKEFILGEDDGTGNRVGGLKDAMNEHFIQPLKDFGTNFKDDFFGFIKESMIDPLNDAITPIASEIAFQTKRVVFGIPKWFLNLGKDYIAMPLMNQLNDKVIGPVATGIKKVFGGIFARVKGLVSLPFRAIGGVGNMVRGHQIKQGRDQSGFAKDRLAFAKKQGIDSYDYQGFDELLAGSDEEQLRKITAYTGMLAHGTDYFDKEIKRAKTELSRVVSEYYKLGWFSKDKGSYKRLKKYIHDNMVEEAIAELANIKKSRATGGPLGEDAQAAIDKFSKANRRYQVARDNKNKFGTISEFELKQQLAEEYGIDADSVNAKRLFDYARKELKHTNGMNVSKSTLFSDPESIVTAGEEKINTTLEKIVDILTKGDYTFLNDKDNKAYEDAEAAGTAEARRIIGKRGAKLKGKLYRRDLKFANEEEITSLLSKYPEVSRLVLAAGSKGINYDDETVRNLCKMELTKKDIDLLIKYPYIPTLYSKSEIDKVLTLYRHNKAHVFMNRFFGAKAQRKQDLSTMNFMAMSNANVDLSKLIKDENDDEVSWADTQYGKRKYIKNSRGDWSLDLTHADTKKSLEEEHEEKENKNIFFKAFNKVSSGLSGFFDIFRSKDEDEKKNPWYKKLFSFDFGGLIKTGTNLAALLATIGAVTKLWNTSKENDGIVYNIGMSVGNTVGPYITKLKDWFTNEGEYSDKENDGFAGFLNKHVFPNLMTGMNIVFGKILPATFGAFMANIHTLIGAGLEGVGSIFGWTKPGSKKVISISREELMGGSAVKVNTSGSSGFIKNSLTGIVDSTVSSIFSSTNIPDISNKVENDRLGKVYIKNENGELVQATYDQLQNANEYWTGNGNEHWTYDEATGRYIMDEEDQPKSGVGKELLGRLASVTGRSFLTGGKAGIFGGLSKGVLGTSDNILRATIGKIPLLGRTYNLGSSLIKGVGKGFEEAGSIGSRIGSKLSAAVTDSGSLTGGIKKIVEYGTESNSKIIKGISKFIDSGLDKFFSLSFVKDKIKDGLTSVGKKGAGKVVKNIASEMKESLAGKLIKWVAGLGPKILSGITKAIGSAAFGIVLAISDFIVGIDKAESILQIKNPNIVQTLLAGLINVLVNRFFFGLVDSSAIVNLVSETILPFFNVDLESFNQDREEVSREVEEYNKEYGTDLSEAEYLEETKSVSGQVKNFFSKLNPFKKKNNTTKISLPNNVPTSALSKNGNLISDSAAGMRTYSAKGTLGNNFVSQLDPKYKSKKFNIAGDTESQTLGDSGCAPATAANVLNYYRGQGTMMDNASNVALKYKDKNGGVTPDYFSDYLGRNGIGTRSTTNRKEMLQSIGAGQPTILLGTDPSNKARTPYGAASSHYVLATGLDGKGNVIIQDPESRRPNALYPVKDVIAQSHMGVITGRGTRKAKSITSKVRGKLGKFGFGRGSNTINQDLAKWSPISNADLDKFIKGVRSDCPFTGKAINAAAKASGLDPRYILAHAAVESAWGTSTYGKKHHNYFGIGAFDSDPDNAINYGNNSMEAGLIEGAKWIRSNFYDVGQTTLYTMRYNGGSHEYCTSEDWVYTIASIMDSMPANTNATYHKADSSVTASGSNAADGLFGKISSAMLSYYDSDLINLIWGDTTSNTGIIDHMPNAVDANGSASAVVQVALNEVNYKATATNSNKYAKEYGNGLDGQPWCAIFVWWVFKHAGCPDQFYGGQQSAYCPDILNYYKAHGQLVDINQGRAGDIVFFNWKGGTSAQHVGIIETNNNNGTYRTIEGNTGTQNRSNGGQVMNPERSVKNIIAIARPNYSETSSGMGSIKKKSVTYLDTRKTSRSSNIAASIMSGRGTNKAGKYVHDVLNNSRSTSSNILTRSTTKTSMPTITNTRIMSGRATTSLPSLTTSSGVTRSVTSGVTAVASGNATSHTEKLLAVIIEILQVIANNSEKLSDIVTLLSKALDLNLTNDDISNLSSNNAKIKNKIANALKAQGTANGLGNSSMSATTESLAAAMYSIARA